MYPPAASGGGAVGGGTGPAGDALARGAKPGIAAASAPIPVINIMLRRSISGTAHHKSRNVKPRAIRTASFVGVNHVTWARTQIRRFDGTPQPTCSIDLNTRDSADARRQFRLQWLCWTTGGAVNRVRNAVAAQ